MPKITLPKAVLKKVESLLAGIDANVGLDVFHDIMELVYIETFGSYHGLTLLDAWYSQSVAYPGTDAVADLWYAYYDDEKRHFGMAKLQGYVHEDQSSQPNPTAPIKRSNASARYRIH